MRDFFLRTAKVEGTANLYVAVRKRTPAVSLKLNTKISVDIKQWEKAQRDVSSMNKYMRAEPKVFGFIKAIDEGIDDLLAMGVTEKARFDEMIDDIIYREIREAEQERKAAQLKAEQEKKQSPIFFLAEFVEGIKDGTILNGGEHYAPNTIKVWNSFTKIFGSFFKKHPFKWKNLNEDTVNGFITFMEKGEYMTKSINKYLICFRALAQRAADNRLISVEAMSAFKKKKKRVLEKHKATEIYLTADEVQALYEMPLQGKRAEARDVFLVGVYTCQRYSDYSEIKAENFSVTAKGTKVIRLIQQKTKNEVVIPVLNDNLLHIARRYKYNLPQVSDVLLNRYIKNILQELSISVPSLADVLPTVLTQKEVTKEERGEVSFARDKEGRPLKHRYELISTHSARRTGITNLYLTGRFNVLQMMAISGHRDSKTFAEYIKLSSDEKADEISEIANNLF